MGSGVNTHTNKQTTDNQPEKVFHVKQFAEKARKPIGRTLRVSWGLFLVGGILSYFFELSGIMMAIFLSLAIILAGVDLFFSILTDPIQDTIIELYQNKIVRKGNRLQYAEISFEDIGKLWEDDKGIWLSRKGLKTNIKLFLSDMNRIAEKDIIFIPKQIEQYTQLKQHLFSLNPE